MGTGTGTGTTWAREGVRAGEVRTEAIRILESLRRIIRAVDLHSRRLSAGHGVTAPQYLCLRAVAAAGGLTPSGIAREVHLSPSTVIGILDRLEARGLARRDREEADRRRVRVSVTAAGRTLLRRTPALLQDRLSAGLRALRGEERASLARALETVVALMEAGHVDAAPILTTGAIGTGGRGPGRGGAGRGRAGGGRRRRSAAAGNEGKGR